MTTSFWKVAAASLFFLSASSPCLAEIKVPSVTPKQGQVVEITVQEPGSSEQSAPHTVKFNGNTYKLFPFPIPGAENSFKTLIGIPADLKPGKYKLSSSEESVVLTVRAGHFPLQYLRLPPGKDNFLMSPGEEKAVDEAKSTCSDERLWRGVFTPPSKARTSTEFGLKRVVNGKLLEDYFHSGLDFAGGEGSPITACANGKVVLAHMGYRLHGNIVAIDHGQGVVSFYIHMSKILVNVGDEVKMGEKIGAVGHTGRANGPHLHFSIYVNKVATNPRDWFNIGY